MGEFPIAFSIVMEERAFTHFVRNQLDAEAFCHGLQLAGGHAITIAGKKTCGKILGEAQEVLWRSRQLVLYGPF
jgi:hypothetical protein